MSQQVASLYAEIGAKVEGFTQGASKVKTDLGGLASDISKTTGQFNGQFRTALLGGKANMDAFGASLLEQGEKAGLSTEQMMKLSGATGIYSDQQMKVAQSTVNVTAKAEELSAAVKNGEMTAEQAGQEFQAYAKSQQVAEVSTISLQSAMMIGIPIILAVAGALYQTEKAADAAARGDARLEAVIKSTGEAAGYNFKQLDSMAQGLSKITGIDDDLIKKSEAVQLTFTNIGHNIFPQATKAALDLSAVLGTDLQGATIQVDKALNDFSGYTALKRAGVSFSDEQIVQIKNFKATNDLAGYQKLVLSELTKEFGGAAAAMHDAGDKSEDVAIAWGNLTENAGGGLVPALRGINVYVAESIDGWNRFFQGLNNGSDGVKIFGESLKQIAMTGIPMLRLLDTISTWGNQMDGDNKAANAMTDLSNATDGATSSNVAYVPSAEEVAQANKAISDANIALVGTIQQMQDAEDSFTQKSADLTQQRLDAEAALQAAMSSGHELTIAEYDGLQAKIDEVKAKEADLAAERDKQTLQFISNILLQKLEVDGLTTAEFDAFAKQQEAWGLWSADTVEKAKAAWMEADKITASINAIPITKTVTVTVNTQINSNGGVGPIDQQYGPNLPPGGVGNDGGRNPDGSYNYQRGGPSVDPTVPRPPRPQGNWVFSDGQWVPWNSDNWFGQHSIGGDFMVPMSYGNEGFRMGNGDTASGGELITITPANKQGSGQGGFEIDYDRMARAFRDALQELGR